MKRFLKTRLLALTLVNIIVAVVFLLTPDTSIADIGPDTSHVWSDRARIIDIDGGRSLNCPEFFKELIIDPCRLKEGEEQYFSIWAGDPQPEGGIETVTVSIETDKGKTVFHLKLVEGTKEEGRWMGSWVASGISQRIYYFTRISFIAKNAWIQDRNLYLCPILERPPLNPEWMYFGQENSPLPSYTIMTLVVDPWQNIWIGTYEGGLAKFDGTNWVVYNESNSKLPGNSILALVFDNQENLWIGIDGRGLAKFDGENWVTYNQGNSRIPSDYVNVLASDSQGNIWIGSRYPENVGLVKFDGENWTEYNKDNSGLPHNFVTAIAIDSQDNLWVGTEGGLAKFDGDNWVVYNKDNSGLPNNSIHALAIDSQDNIWIGLCPGQPDISTLTKFDGENWTLYNLLDNFGFMLAITAIAIDSQDNLWLGRPNCGVDEWVFLKFNGVKYEILENRVLVSNIVRCLVIDAYGNKWIGQNNFMSGGLSVYREGGVILNNPVVAVQERYNEEPLASTLSQNYPNPFNPSTEISFSLPENSQVTLRVFNTLGQQVATLVDEKREAGNYQVIFDGADFPTGIYFYCLETQGFAKTMKMLLMK